MTKTIMLTALICLFLPCVSFAMGDNDPRPPSSPLPSTQPFVESDDEGIIENFSEDPYSWYAKSGDIDCFDRFEDLYADQENKDPNSDNCLIRGRTFVISGSSRDVAEHEH